MKTEVIRSGDKNFEEEKAKMFKPKQLTKEEQLRQVFKNILEDWGLKGSDVDNVAWLLLREVKIRTKL